VSESAPREVVVETRDAEIVLSNQGARVVHWRLKRYMDPKGGMVDLVPSDLPAGEATPFVLRVQDPMVTRRIQTALYRVSGDEQGKVDATTEAKAVEFTYQAAGGLSVKKILRFESSRNIVTLTADVQSGSSSLNPTVLWGPGLGDQGASAGGGQLPDRQCGAAAASDPPPQRQGGAARPGRAVDPTRLRRRLPIRRNQRPLLPRHRGQGGQVHSEFVPVTLPGPTVRPRGGWCRWR
jgi:hypothetical protein